MTNTIINKNFTLVILSFITVVFSISCCKDKCRENKIIVVEYEPMVLYDWDTPFSMDVDLDGNNDIQAYFYDHSGYGEYYFKSFNPDDCMLSKGEYRENRYQKYLFENDSINNSLTWVSATPFFHNSSDSLKGDYFLGIRILRGDSIYYGWVLPIYVYPATAQYKQGYYIKKTAFCTVPNQPILAGQEFFFLEE